MHGKGKPMEAKVIKIDLDQARPESIEDDVSPLALAAAVETLENWNERRLAVVDEVLTNWAADAIGRPNDREGLVDLQSAIGRILHAKASQAAGLNEIDPKEPATYANRWNGFYDAIAARHIVLAERNPDRARSLMHVAAIEAQLAHGEIRQSEIQAATGLTPSRLSQVLSLMDAHGMITRRVNGKEKLVKLAHDGSAAEPDVTRPAGTARRGASYLTLRKAA